MVKICPVKMNGSSTGRAPIHVNIITILIKSQKVICFKGKNWVPRSLSFGRNGIINKIETDKTRAITPPSLLGIERRIAYAKRKYHSG
jgi:hypothetical protein